MTASEDRSWATTREIPSTVPHSMLRGWTAATGLSCRMKWAASRFTRTLRGDRTGPRVPGSFLFRFVVCGRFEDHPLADTAVHDNPQGLIQAKVTHAFPFFDRLLLSQPFPVE